MVEFLKQPGDQVVRDEPIYVMETDKATTDVESPYDGTLVEWTAEPGTVLEIGSEVGKMEVADGVQEMPAGHEPTSSDDQEAAAGPEIQAVSREKSNVVIPPRTRKYLKEKGLLDQVDQIPVSGSKMMPDDVDRYLASMGTQSDSGGFAPESNDQFEDIGLPKNQISLNYRLVRGASACVPVTVMQAVCWDAIDQARSEAKQLAGSDAPSAFAMMLSCVVQTLKDYPRLRSTLVGDGRYYRTYRHVNLGVAVGLPGDELVTAVVPAADKLNREEFFASLKEAIADARDGNDQADASVATTVSNIGSAGMRWGIPAIVSPGVATLAVGECYNRPVPDGNGFRFEKSVDLTLSFDHRVMNGVGAAEFMNDLRNRIELYS